MQNIDDPGMDNCNKYIEKYHKCVSENSSSSKLKECRKILKYY
jgi:hypothetical protein